MGVIVYSLNIYGNKRILLFVNLFKCLIINTLEIHRRTGGTTVSKFGCLGRVVLMDDLKCPCASYVKDDDDDDDHHHRHQQQIKSNQTNYAAATTHSFFYVIP